MFSSHLAPCALEKQSYVLHSCSMWVPEIKPRLSGLCSKGLYLPSHLESSMTIPLVSLSILLLGRREQASIHPHKKLRANLRYYSSRICFNKQTGLLELLTGVWTEVYKNRDDSKAPISLKSSLGMGLDPHTVCRQLGWLAEESLLTIVTAYLTF